MRDILEVNTELES